MSLAKKLDDFINEHETVEVRICNNDDDVKLCTIIDQQYDQYNDTYADPISVHGEGTSTEEAFDDAVEKYEEEERALSDKNWTPAEC